MNDAVDFEIVIIQPSAAVPFEVVIVDPALVVVRVHGGPVGPDVVAVGGDVGVEEKSRCEKIVEPGDRTVEIEGERRSGPQAVNRLKRGGGGAHAHLLVIAQHAGSLADGVDVLEEAARINDGAAQRVNRNLPDVPVAAHLEAVRQLVAFAIHRQDAKRRLAVHVCAVAGAGDRDGRRLLRGNLRGNVDRDVFVKASREADDGAAVHLADQLRSEHRKPFMHLFEPFVNAPTDHRVFLG